MDFKSEIVDFLTEFEHIYAYGDPGKVYRMRLCIFQLIHLPSHIKWYKSVKIGFQATIERTIGKLGHQVCSKRVLFAYLAELVSKQQLIYMLSLYYLKLDNFQDNKAKPPLYSKFYYAKRDFVPGNPLYQHIQIISTTQDIVLNMNSNFQ